MMMSRLYLYCFVLAYKSICVGCFDITGMNSSSSSSSSGAMTELISVQHQSKLHDNDDVLSYHILDNNQNKNRSNPSCSSYTNCTECINSSNVCHWCADEKCHAKGSFYGCTIGASCNPPNSSAHNDTCHSHTTCTECTLASNVCHWCAFDDQCHAIGSIYGCTYGVNCYSNDRCQRVQPEYVYERWYHGIGFLPLFFILGSVSMILCCSTVLYVVTETLIHGLYQLLSTSIPTTTSDFSTTTLHERTYKQRQRHSNISNNNNPRQIVSKSTNSTLLEEAVPFLDAMEVEIDEEEEGNGIDRSNNVESSSTSFPPQVPLQLNTNHRHLKLFMKTCKVWYTTTWVLTVSCLVTVLYLFPKVPQFNVCSDQVAWKSIIDGITSLKVEASFEILISIYNPNHISLGMDGVNGKLNHDGDEIGTFTVPSSMIHAKSITDILVLCTVVPDKWEALGLISEYYKGTLVFDISAGGMVRIPAIGFNIPVKLSDFLVPVNDLPSDRHLCSCPQWKDVKTIKPLLMDNTMTATGI